MSTPTPQASAAVSYRAILAQANFLRLWLGATISRVGDNLTRVGIYLLAMDLGGSQAGALAWVTFAYTAPWIFGPFAGVLVDRWDKRRTLIAADLIRGAMVLLLPFVKSLPPAYVLLFCVTAVGTVARPAFLTTVPETVSRKSHVHAASLFMQFTDFLMDIVGFGGAALLVARVGLRATFLLDAATYFVSAMFVARMTVQVARSPAARGLAGVTRDLLGGLRYHLETPLVLSLLVVMTWSAAGIGIFNTIFPLAMVELQGLPEAWLGYLYVAHGVGMSGAAYAIGRYAQRVPKARIIVPGFLLFGLAAVAISLARGPVPTFLGYLVFGAANAMFFPTSVAWLQEIVPAEVRGRVMSFRLTCIMGAMALGAMLADPSVARLGLRGGIWLAAAVMGAPGIFGLLLPGLRAAFFAARTEPAPSTPAD